MVAERREEKIVQPQCWPVGNYEEIRSPHHGFEDYETLENGPSHSKRRHKASPLSCYRTTRSVKLRERVSSSSPNHCPSTSSPIAGPSCPGPADCGYNSGDEYDSSQKAKITEAEWIEEDRSFEKKMRKRGFLVKKMSEDGACLFRAVADQIYGDQDMHPEVRKHCMDYIATNSDYFSQYVTEDFNKYVNRKRLEYTHGNHIEMQAMSEMYNRTIEVFCYGKGICFNPINIFHGMHKTDNEPIRLSYQRGSHYNSIVDPHKATIGVGLGLPSFTPGAAETNLLKDAVRQSEDFHIEQAMLEDKLRATDWEATNEAIEEHVARDSYLQWLRDNEKRGKNVNSGGASSTATSEENSSTSPNCQAFNPKPATEEKLNCQLVEETHFFNMVPPQMFGLSEWEDADILARVLAQSQQEYLDNLKKSRGITPQNKECTTDSETPSTSR
ncbi:hypothetical protein AAG570_012567 [Ranatra chinensis]|uniref:ubiquitinyl hydrolase 1 n=1 Tax=Ranatra chinensis TaxID=642074 RepID=A0ABD0YSX2_9HEMI